MGKKGSLKKKRIHLRTGIRDIKHVGGGEEKLKGREEHLLEKKHTNYSVKTNRNFYRH